MKKENQLHLMLIGSGGDGVMATASMILNTAAKRRLYGVMTQSYGPQIRGGESAAHVTLGVEPVQSVGFEKDLIVSFRFADVLRFVKEFKIADNGVVLHGIEKSDLPEALKTEKGETIPINFQEVLEKNGLPEIAKNVFLFGILLKALGWDLKEGENCVREIFAHKSGSVVDGNLKALAAGFEHFKNLELPWPVLVSSNQKERWVLTGNEACARAAVEAGCRFYAGYPITPSSEILEEMHQLLPKVGGKLIQAEDEISAIGMVIGASYGGVPAMTATSGPGLSLMTEMMGLASMAEIPVVVIDCQRAGPSTGMPSRTEQSDLWHCLYGGHGDFPRVVLAANDVGHCFETICRAFYCAETFQLPVFVLSDALIAQSVAIIDPIDIAHFPKGKRYLPPHSADGYRRFSLEGFPGFEGISPMALPGMSGFMHSIAGIEHAEAGNPSSDGAHHEAMNQKRFQKIKSLSDKTAGWFSEFGFDRAPHLLIAWGSSATTAKEFAKTHPDFAVFIPEILHPFPLEALEKALRGRKKITVLEMNYQGQLYHTLRALGAIDKNAQSFKRSGGIPFRAEELEALL